MKKSKLYKLLANLSEEEKGDIIDFLSKDEEEQEEVGNQEEKQEDPQEESPQDNIEDKETDENQEEKQEEQSEKEEFDKKSEDFQEYEKIQEILKDFSKRIEELENRFKEDMEHSFGEVPKSNFKDNEKTDDDIMKQRYGEAYKRFF